MFDSTRPIWRRESSVALAEAVEMRRLLLTIPARQRSVLVLRLCNNLTESQVARAFGTSRGPVSGYTARGLARLRERVREDAVPG